MRSGDVEVRKTLRYFPSRSTITPTVWQNPYFKEQITIVGLSGIIP